MGHEPSTGTSNEMSTFVRHAFNETRQLLPKAQCELDLFDKEILAVRRNLDNLLHCLSVGAEHIEKLGTEYNYT